MLSLYLLASILALPTSATTVLPWVLAAALIIFLISRRRTRKVKGESKN